MNCTSSSMFQLRCIVVLVSCWGTLGCDREEEKKAAPPVASSPAAAPAPPVTPVVPWYQKDWKGEAELTLLPSAQELDRVHRSASPEGSPQEGKAAPETGNKGARLSVEVTVDEDRQARGSAQLNQAEMRVVGLLDEQKLRLQLRGQQASGTLVLSRETDKELFSGRAQLSLVEASDGKAQSLAYEGTLSLSVSR